MSKALRADLMMVLITMFWGASSILTKIGLGSLQEFNLIALRFGIGFALAGLVFFPRIRRIDRKTLGYSAILGTILFIVLIFMTFGVRYTTASNAGFLTCLSGMVVPVIALLVFGQKVQRKVMVSIAIAFLGVYLLAVKDTIHMNIGDLLCLLCSVAFAVHIIVTDNLTKKVDSVALGILQLGFVGAYSLIFSLILEVPRLPESQTAWLVVLGLSIFCTALGFIMQTVAQQFTSPAHTGLIFTLEPAFAAVFAFIALGEMLTARGYVGALLLFGSIVLVELDVALFHKKTAETPFNEMD